MVPTLRRHQDITLEVPMELYPHFLDKLTHDKLIELETPAGVIGCRVLRVARAANLISASKFFCDVTLRPTGVTRTKVSDSVSLRLEQYRTNPAKFIEDFITDDRRSTAGAQRQADEILQSFGSPIHPNCRSTMGVDWATATKEKPMKIRNKFYVAAPSVSTHAEQDQDNVAGQVPLDIAPQRSSGGKWTRKDLKSAIDHATAMLEANQNLEHVAISKIVTIVRRKKVPVVVEHVK